MPYQECQGIASHFQVKLVEIKLLFSNPHPQVKYWIYGDPEEDGKVIDVKSPQAELTNLYPYCDYEMRVCSYNAIGQGGYGDMVPCQTLEDGELLGMLRSLW